MRFFMISDLHLGEQKSLGMALENLDLLCRAIRADVSPDDLLLFIFMGDLIDRGKAGNYEKAVSYVNKLQQNLDGYNIRLEYIPGNHDLPEGNIESFDEFLAAVGGRIHFKNTSVYSHVYEGVNFIFADSNLGRQHDAPGQLDFEKIKSHIIQGKENLLFCHHGFTHFNGGSHDIIEGGAQALKQLEGYGINFVFHGHTHKADATVPDKGIVEIGCGALLKDVGDMPGIPNQFTVGFINSAHLRGVNRYVVVKDGTGAFPKEMLYPRNKKFEDPDSILREKYDDVSGYIPRKVSPHENSLQNPNRWWLNSDDKTSLFEATKKMRRILLLSDAAMGKSVEIRHLAYSFMSTRKYPYLIKLRQYEGQKIDELLDPTYLKLNPSLRVLLFDGYDELNQEMRDCFEIKLSVYLDENPETVIVVSSRPNFCKSEKTNQSKTFCNLAVYDLCELESTDIESYLKSIKIDLRLFRQQADNLGLWPLMSNPFYLTGIATIYKDSGNLPTKAKLMDQLIESTFEKDNDKFPGHLEERYDDIMNLLKEVAMGMQLMQVSLLDDRTQYQKLINFENRKLLQQTGIFQKVGDKWEFIHNNFREYLAAKYLQDVPQSKVLELISDGENLKPSWVNVTAFLCTLDLNWDLVKWITEHCPSILAKFGPDHVDPETRCRIFQRIFSEIETKYLFLDDEICTYRQLAQFAQNESTLTFLLKKISDPLHKKAQYTALNILRHFSKTFGRENEIRECLLECCNQYPKISPQNFRIAVFALCQMGLNTKEISSHLTHKFMECDNDYVRLGIYEYLIYLEQQDTYVNFFIKGLSFLEMDDEHDSKRIGNEAYELNNGLRSMKTSEGIVMVINWILESEFPDYYDLSSIFKKLVSTSIELYKQKKGADQLYHCILDCWRVAVDNCEPEYSNTCYMFFKQTNTLTSAILFMVDNDDACGRLAWIFNGHSEAILCVLEAYKNQQYNGHSIYKQTVEGYVTDKKKYEECNQIYLKRTGNQLKTFAPRVDYVMLEKESEQEFFDALFSIERVQEMVARLVSTMGNPDLLIRDLSGFRAEIPHYSVLNKLKHVILYTAKDRDAKVVDFLKDIDFDYFTICESFKIIKSKSNVAISTAQISKLKQLIDAQVSKDILQSEIKYRDKFSCSKLVWAIAYLCSKFDFILDKDNMLRLIALPEDCFYKNEERGKYLYLAQSLKNEEIVRYILGLIENKRFCNINLKEYFEFFTTLQSHELVSFACNLCCDVQDDDTTALHALTYIYELEGWEYIAKHILKHAHGNFLLDLISICKDIPPEVLLPTLEAEYKLEPYGTLLAYLIQFDSSMGINDYVKQVEKLHTIPDSQWGSESATAAVKSISNPERLPYLKRLMDELFSPGFVDGSFHTLYNSLWGALLACAGKDREATENMVKEYLIPDETPAEQLAFCNGVLRSIIKNDAHNRDIALEIKPTKKLLNMLKEYQ